METETPELSVEVLVVDDHADARKAMRAMIERPGYQVVEAASGDEALLEVLQHDFAAILLDVVMPGMSGLELAKAIRERERSAEIPILFLTGVATEVEEIFRGYRSGAVDYLVKPFNAEIVRAKLEVFAQLQRQRRRIEAQSEELVSAERERAELRLLQQQFAHERRYRRLADAMPHIVWTARPDGRVKSFNQQWERLTGLHDLEARQGWLEAVLEVDRERVDRAWQRSLETGEMFGVECRLTMRHGGPRWFLGLAVPEQNPPGVISGWIGTFTDIDARVRSERALSEFRATLDAVLEAVMILDPESFRFHYVNDGAVLLFGRSRESLLKMDLPHVLSAMDETQLRSRIGPSGQQVTIEAKVQRPDESTLPVELSLQLLGAGTGGLICVGRDITERQRVEHERETLYRRAVEAVGARDEFLSVASHELKTPLTAMLFQLEEFRRLGARDGRLSLSRADTQVKLDRAFRQVTRLGKLVDQLLDVSRANTGRLNLAPEQIDLAGLVNELVDRRLPEARLAGTDLEVSASGAVVGRWDRLRVEQVVENLLSNALKFGRGHPVELSVNGDGVLATLEVRDHGIGIGHDDVDRIFRRFERAVSAHRYGGLGLGLYIARQIVEAHAGRIRVESEPGQGARFVVELPVEPRVFAEPLQPPGAEEERAPQLSA